MELQELVEQVEEVALSDEPLDRLSAAMEVKVELDEVGDSLIGHFVDEARRAGCSWSEIGAAMGVTKQAAQQRHRSERPRRERPPWRMGRWTGRAKTVVKEAHEAAMRSGADEIRTEHLLLGVLAVPEGLAGRIVIAAGLTREHVADVSRWAPARRRRTHLGMDAEAQRAVVQALQNALRLGHNYVGTEHLLLGLLDVPESAAAAALARAGLTKDDVERQVLEALKGVA